MPDVRSLKSQVSDLEQYVSAKTPEQIIESSKRYVSRRRILENNLKSKNYWPDGITHPNNYRKFYVANDLSYCGFAQTEGEIGQRRMDYVRQQQASPPNADL
jgi:hypothetical protein